MKDSITMPAFLVACAILYPLAFVVWRRSKRG